MTDENTEDLQTDPIEDVVTPDAADLQDQIHGLHGRIDTIEQGISKILVAITPPDAPPAEVPVDPTLADLPEGTTRFFCITSSDFQISLKKKSFVTTAAGVHEPVPERFLQFQNHIATTDDEELIDLARAYIEKMGTRSEFHEDRQAQPVTHMQVTEGVRTAPVRQPVPDPQAMMAARL